MNYFRKLFITSIAWNAEKAVGISIYFDFNLGFK